MAIARAMHEADDGEFAQVRFGREQLKALRIASWMHDVGKIATPEYVVDKTTKLETIFDRIELVRARYDTMRKDAEVRLLRTRLEFAMRSGVFDAYASEQVTPAQRDMIFAEAGGGST